VKRYLFEYICDGSTYGVEIIAPDLTEARRRIYAMRAAEYKGEIFATVKLGWIDRLSLIFKRKDKP
jgi:hypothetical protein